MHPLILVSTGKIDFLRGRQRKTRWLSRAEKKGHIDG
jgi:hypothetical protein